MAPEVLLPKTDTGYTEAVDLWSCGVLLYIMSVGGWAVDVPWVALSTSNLTAVWITRCAHFLSKCARLAGYPPFHDNDLAALFRQIVEGLCLDGGCIFFFFCRFRRGVVVTMFSVAIRWRLLLASFRGDVGGKENEVG